MNIVHISLIIVPTKLEWGKEKYMECYGSGEPLFPLPYISPLSLMFVTIRIYEYFLSSFPLSLTLSFWCSYTLPLSSAPFLLIFFLVVLSLSPGLFWEKQIYWNLSFNWNAFQMASTILFPSPLFAFLHILHNMYVGAWIHKSFTLMDVASILCWWFRSSLLPAF